ncbi:hypothetical protein [Kordiimonas pumila]|uniref:Solute-binding protein family 3/N-terminal domain-containing protein n=1 Tax=Kordiimonas pumila TaxID=2161677 RepID=A0ABV7D684_9PROT|nr:hypothetical protein [Kordiimonas pumila]
MPLHLYRVLLCLIAAVYLQTGNRVFAKADNTCLTISTSPDKFAFEQQLQNRIEAIYKQAGLCVNWINLPPMRANRLLLDGTIDGNLIRPEELVKRTNPSWFYLPTPLFEAEPTMIIASKLKYDCTNKSLKGIKLGYPYGKGWVDRNIKKYGPELLPLTNLHEVNELITRHRIDAFIFDKAHVLAIKEEIDKTGFETNICYWPKVKIYHVMHTRHIDKKDLLDSILANMSPAPQNDFIKNAR